MANDKRFVAKNGLDNNSATITNVASPVNLGDASNKLFSSDASNLTAGIVPAARLSGSYSIDIAGNAGSATKLQTSRTISLTGDVTGSVTFDGTANASITATIAANSVALGTDTTGNYAASVAVSGNGLTITGAAGEGTAFTVNSNATNLNTASTIVFRDSAGNFSAGTITANLAGNATSANTATNATNATNVAVTSDNTNASRFITFSPLDTATVGLLTDPQLTYNPSTDTLNIVNLSATGITTSTLSTSGTVTIGGNLIVNGTTITVNSTTTTLDDPIITLGGDVAPGADDNKDRGVEFRWHDGTSAKVGFFGFDDSTGFFTFIPDGTNTSEVFAGATGVIDATRITGSAASWTTARTITLTGDVTGSVSIDGSANVSLSTTIAANSVALGTDTTGNYVAAGAVSGNGLSGSAAAEGATFTVTSNATSANTASTIVFRDASGNFSAGTITAALSGNATSATSATTAVNVQMDVDDSSTATHYITFGSAGGSSIRAKVSNKLTFQPSSGNVTSSGNITAFSDARLKTDVKVIENALDKVKAIRGVTYTRVDTASKDIGVIAQEVQKVIPEVIVQNEQYLSVAYGNLVAVLIEAIKELEERVKQLEGGV